MDLCGFDCFETTYEHNPQASVLVVWVVAVVVLL